MPTAKQGYRVADGARVPSVTTIISRFKDSGALMKWAYTTGREHGFIEGRGGQAPTSLYEVSGKAADIGTAAHSMVEASIKGEHPEMAQGYINLSPEDREKAMNAFSMYKEWASQSNLVIVEQEMYLVSEKYRFGGTPDAIGEIGGKLCLVDWKTSNGVYCHTPDTLVLTSDLRWVQAGDIRVSESLAAFSEDRTPEGLGGRHRKTGSVTHAEMQKSSDGIRLVFESGREITSTPHHQYLTHRSCGGRKNKEGGALWVKAEDLIIGNALFRYFDPWQTDRSYRAGYVSGVFDGEGSLSNYTAQNGQRLSFAQKPGAVLDQTCQYLDDMGFRYTCASKGSGIVDCRILGGFRENAAFLGMLRPARLLPKFEFAGNLMTPRDCRDKIVAIERTGPIEVMAISTDAKTYFANGYGSHNSDYLLQLAAYRVLWDENNPDRTLTGGSHLCRFAKEFGDFAHHYYDELDDAWTMFELLLKAYRLDQVLRKRA